MQIWRKITDNWKFEKRCNYQGARQVAWYTEADWGVGGKSEKLYFLINGVGRQSLRFGGVSAQTQPWGSRGGGSANSRPSIEGENSHQYTCTNLYLCQYTSTSLLVYQHQYWQCCPLHTQTIHWGGSLRGMKRSKVLPNGQVEGQRDLNFYIATPPTLLQFLILSFTWIS